LDTEHHHFGHQRETQVDGRFLFEVSHPGERAWLSIDAGPWWTTGQISFASKGNEDRPLKLGPQDVGDIVLRVAGAVEGLVVDPSGRPIPKALVSLKQGGLGYAGTTGLADDKGQFLIEHVPPGEYGPVASAPAFVTGSGPSVLVMASAKSPALRLVLEPGPRVWGRVVDQNGQGVAGLKWTLGPQEGGHMVTFESGLEGRFDLALRTLCAHWLRLNSSGWDLLYEGNVDPEALNGQSLELPVRAWPVTRFVVRDRSTGQPIERFGIIVSPEHSLFSRFQGQSRTPIADYPGGVLELPARPEVDGVMVVAPDYEALDVPVTWSAIGSQECELWLEPRGAVIGRVLGPAGPLADAPWKLESSVSAIFNLEPLEGRSDAQGRFEIRGHCGGPYRLLLNANHTQNLIRDGIKVPSAQDLDLGDLLLNAPGRLDVQVLMPPGEALMGVKVVAQGPDGTTEARTDESGQVHLGGLSAGNWRLSSPGTTRVGDSGLHLVKVTSGAATKVTLDLSARTLCQLDLEFEFVGDRPESPNFTLLPAKGPPTVDGKLPRQWDLRVRDIDSLGRWSGNVLPSGPTRISYEAAPGCSVTLPAPVLNLTPGAAVQARVRVELGSLDLQLAPAFQWPSQGTLGLTFEAFGDGDFQWETYGELPPSKPTKGFQEPLEFSAGVLHCYAAPVGRYRVTLTIQDRGKWDPNTEEPVLLEFAPGIRALSADVTVVAGQSAEAVLGG
jgi:hypothetical protein